MKTKLKNIVGITAESEDTDLPNPSPRVGFAYVSKAPCRRVRGKRAVLRGLVYLHQRKLCSDSYLLTNVCVERLSQGQGTGLVLVSGEFAFVLLLMWLFQVSPARSRLLGKGE